MAENANLNDTKQVLSTTSTISTTTTTVSTTISQIDSNSISILSELEEEEPEVYVGDLERSIQYIVNKEISAQATLDELRLNAVYQLLENVIRYLPLRRPLRNFLVALRDWPIRMEFKKVTGQHYADKVDELIAIYQPFKATPADYEGCRGSTPIYRGYPCSLWQLFHTLMVNAAIKGDPSMALGGASTVAKTMVNYVYYFFSCRHCADNFRKKVNMMGFLPSSPRDSILWLWQIHNMANAKLKGDPTEDPQHPKIIWPSTTDCPDCRTDRMDLFNLDPQIAFVEGQLWNLTRLVEYSIKVYGTEQLAVRPLVVPNSDATANSATEAPRQVETTTMDNIVRISDGYQGYYKYRPGYQVQLGPYHAHKGEYGYHRHQGYHRNHGSSRPGISRNNLGMSRSIGNPSLYQQRYPTTFRVSRKPKRISYRIVSRT